MWPNWTLDGRIVFLREAAPGPDDIRIVDANGGNDALLEPTIPALTAAGCVVCPNPIADQFEWLLWQPGEENEP